MGEGKKGAIGRALMEKKKETKIPPAKIQEGKRGGDSEVKLPNLPEVS